MISNPTAIAAGHICLDILPDLSDQEPGAFDRAFLPGHLITSGPLTYSSGGSVSNTGLALNQLGIKTHLVAKIGNDLPGKILRQVIASHGKGLTRNLQVDAAQTSSYSVIISYPGADRIFIHDPAANDFFTSEDIPADLLKCTNLFHFGYPPVMRSTFVNRGTELKRIFQKARDMGLITSLDMATPDPASDAGKVDWREILLRILPFVDIFMPSVEEILFMLHRDTYQQLYASASDADILPLISPGLLSSLGTELTSMGAALVGLKLGYQGLYLRTAAAPRLRLLEAAGLEQIENWEQKEFWAPCFQVAVSNTTGSGDATIAGFLSALLHGCSLTDCIQMAVAVGACSVEQDDGIKGIRSWEDTLTRMKSGWQQHLLKIHKKGWEFDHESNLWNGPCK